MAEKANRKLDCTNKDATSQEKSLAHFAAQCLPGHVWNLGLGSAKETWTGWRGFREREKDDQTNEKPGM